VEFLAHTLHAGLSEAWSVFLTTDEQIFVDQGTGTGQIDRWTNVLKIVSLLALGWSVC
jgi:hypothetical protein